MTPNLKPFLQVPGPCQETLYRSLQEYLHRSQQGYIAHNRPPPPLLQVPGAVSGDVILHIYSEEHPEFEREGSDLIKHQVSIHLFI